MHIFLETQELKMYVLKIQGPNAPILQNSGTKKVTFPKFLWAFKFVKIHESIRYKIEKLDLIC